MWGAFGLGVASLVAGFVHDAGNGDYGGVMIVFATVTAVTFAAATALPIGTNVEPAGCQESRGQRYDFQPHLAVSVRVLAIFMERETFRL